MHSFLSVYLVGSDKSVYLFNHHHNEDIEHLFHLPRKFHVRLQIIPVTFYFVNYWFDFYHYWLVSGACSKTSYKWFCTICVGSTYLKKLLSNIPLSSVFLPGESHGQRYPMGYNSIGSERIRHNWASTHSSIVWIYHNCLSIHLFLDIWVVSSLGLLWIKMLWTFFYKSFCVCFYISCVN